MSLLFDAYNHHLQYKCGDGDNWRDTQTAASPISETVAGLTGSKIYTCYVRAKHSPEAPLSVDTYTACSGNNFYTTYIILVHVGLQVKDG